MTEHIIEYLPKSEVKICFTVSVDDAQPYLAEAVKSLSTSKPLPGFRPGHASYDDVKRTQGEMKIWETALERIVRAQYVKAVIGEELDTIGSPSVAVDQLTPGQPIKFTTISPVSPKVLTMPDLEQCHVEKTMKPIKEENVDRVLERIRGLQRSEVLVMRAATADDLVMIDLIIKKDQVILEGGTSIDYRVPLNEPHYIPGFAEQLLGMSTGDVRTFQLPFPADHFQKHLAGKLVEFTATGKAVFELQLPPLDDTFAQHHGLSTLESLRAKLTENLTHEAEHSATEAAEVEMLAKLRQSASFGEIPDVLMNQEVIRMMQELQKGIEDQDMKWADYLSSIKKSTDELKLDFVPRAIERIQTAALMKALAKSGHITITDDELDTEIDRVLSGIKESDRDTRERITSPEYRDYVALVMRNRKTLEWLRRQCVS